MKLPITLLIMLLLDACRQPPSVVVIKTDLGDITVRLFADTPMHSDNFLKFVNAGYYNGAVWDRVIQDLLIQSGGIQAPDSNHLASTTSFIPPEIKHLPLRGALVATRNLNDDSNQSSSTGFFLVQGTDLDEKLFQKLTKSIAKTITAQEQQLYLKHGGAPQLHAQYSVFGAVISGMSVIDKIAAVPRNASDRPLIDVKILQVSDISVISN